MDGDVQVPLPVTIDEFVDRFREIYGHIDGSRSEEALWLQVVEESSSIAEAVREIRYEQILSHAANFFAWLCGFMAKCNKELTSICHLSEDFSEVIWLKYPHICPRCSSNPCECLKRWRELNAREEEQKKQAYKSIEDRARHTRTSRVRNLDDLEAMFEEIHGNNIMVTDIKEIAFHFLEEVGEVSEQIRELRALSEKASRNSQRISETKRELRKELADVFSWLIALLIKVDYLAMNSTPAIDALASIRGVKGIREPLTASPRIRLLRRLILKYYSKNDKMVCRTCHEEKCNLSLHERLYPVAQQR